MIGKYVAIFIYLAILAVITWSSAKRKNVGDFLFASHDIGWIPLSLSIFSSVFSSYNVIVTLTFAFLFGPYVLLIFFGILAAFFGIYFFTRKYESIIREKGFNNIIDFFVLRFDYKVTNTLNLAFIGILFLFIILQLFINTSIFSEFLGWNKYVSATFVGLIVLIYTSVGGLKAEIFTDVFQGILMLLIVALVFMVDTSSINTETVVSLLSDKTLLVGALTLGVAQFLTLLVQPEMWQRVSAARSTSHLKKGFIASWTLLALVVIPMTIIGLAARGGDAVENPSTLFYDILNVAAPEWFFPFLIIALFAAFMSTLDSSLFAISSQLGKYGFVVWLRGREEKEGSKSEIRIARRTRISISIVVILALVASLFFGDFLSGVFNLISILTVVSSAVLMSFILRLSSNETFASILFGMVAFAIAFFGGYISEEAISILYPSFLLIGYTLLQTLVIQVKRRLKMHTWH